MIKRTNSFEMEEIQAAKNGSQDANANQNVTSSKIIKKARQSISSDSLREQEDVANNAERHHNTIDVKEIRMSSQPIPAVAGNMNEKMRLTGNKVRNTRIPQPILETIVKLATGKKPAGGLTNSQISRAIFEKYREIKGDTFICNICEMEYAEKDKQRIGKCSHIFCDSCLRHYVDYKISRFEQVMCPSENCPEVMDTEGLFYKSLTDQHKQKYKKVHAFAMVSKNPNTRLCPNQKCKDGVLTLQEGVNPKCNTCGKVYCSQCLFPEHSGPCESNEIDFFQNNLHFRQCTNCKSVVEKTVGCNHIKCRCNYEFCYLCGGKWLNYEHKCGTNAQGQPVPPPAPGPNCCDCLNGDDCCPSVLRFLVKAIFLFPLFLLLCVMILCLNLLLLAGILFLTILMGIFPYTCEFICDKDCPWNVVFIILYPVSMVIGIGKAFSDFFCEAAPRTLEQLCQQLQGAADCLLLW